MAVFDGVTDMLNDTGAPGRSLAEAAYDNAFARLEAAREKMYHELPERASHRR